MISCDVSLFVDFDESFSVIFAAIFISSFNTAIVEGYCWKYKNIYFIQHVAYVEYCTINANDNLENSINDFTPCNARITDWGRCREFPRNNLSFTWHYKSSNFITPPPP